jgi:hypothetical protein
MIGKMENNSLSKICYIQENLKLEIIEKLVKQYANDQDLGVEIRKFINKKKTQKQPQG